MYEERRYWLPTSGSLFFHLFYHVTDKIMVFIYSIFWLNKLGVTVGIMIYMLQQSVTVPVTDPQIKSPTNIRT